MLPLHDRTRRALCLAGLVTFAALPTVATLGWCGYRCRGAEQHAVAQAIGQAAGMTATLAAVRHVRPGVERLEGLVLCDPETGRQVFRCQSIEVQPLADRGTAAGGPGLSLSVAAAEVAADGVAELARLAERFLCGRAGTSLPRVRIVAPEVQLLEPAQKLVDVAAEIDSVAAGVQAEVRFRLAGLNMAEPARIRVGRNRQTLPPATGFEFYTGGAALPCELLACGLPALAPAGGKARFAGYVWANQAGGGWQGELTGQFNEVDCSTLVADWFPHKFSGFGQVTVARARFRQGRVEELSGTAWAGPGWISRSLLGAAVERLGLTPGDPLRTASDLIPYEQAALAFRLDDRGLVVEGRCNESAGGVILCDRHGRLLCDPAASPLAAGRLVEMLAGDSGVKTRAAARLLRWLPLPERSTVESIVAEGETPRRQ